MPHTDKALIVKAFSWRTDMSWLRCGEIIVSTKLRLLDHTTIPMTVYAIVGLLSVFTLPLSVRSLGGYLQTYPEQNHQTTPLYFGLIMSFPGGEFDSSGAIAGVRVALDRINSDPTVLPNHKLHYTLTNSSVSVTVWIVWGFICTLACTCM